MFPNQDRIFSIRNDDQFIENALHVFQYQYHQNKVYHEFCHHLKVHPERIRSIEQIPFLPIQFFKSKNILTGNGEPQTIFTSSGTSGMVTSKHLVTDLKLYKRSFIRAFELFYGPISNYCILALLPSYLERQGSSLIYMVDALIKKSGHLESGFYLNNLEDLSGKLLSLSGKGQKTLLIGVSFALLDLAKKVRSPLRNTIVMETGGMKGIRKEMVRNELHAILKRAFGVKEIHSEYGMTELLSQGYSIGGGIFNCPPWMKVLTRDTEDPLSAQIHGKTGGINVIDLANINSCAFIATQDLGKTYNDDSFEVLGRFDHSEVRGCNLMVI
ncbi:acyl transferase [Muricauda sp. SCSIO 64092]|uniref:LuxE/PaaK family acyltransferase n=1 Tax=Allomuricauda sp. SCSIO 64092 TaxID=2908842 RepID=UPI001FF54563|nr:acyl transferase [Muricauda sp. SCSIO 64092]UOY04796.1 acyl transferase [Muricauda sp. SCSIO 64092]